MGKDEIISLLFKDVADESFVKKALEIAEKAYAHKKPRKSGEPFIIHPLRTAEILMDWDAPSHVIIAGLLHHVKELDDNLWSLIKNNLETEVENLLKNLSRLQHLTNLMDSHRKRGESQAPGIDLDENWEALIIIVAGFLEQLRTIEFLSKPRQRHFAESTVSFILPIVDSLGMQFVKREIEDGTFAVLEEDKYRNLKSQIDNLDLKDLENKITQVLRREIDSDKDYFKLKAVRRHLYHIYDTERNPLNVISKKSSELLRLIILVPERQDCYHILGQIHATYKVARNALEDYIAKPSASYKSLHTKIFIPDIGGVAIRIRTSEMNEVAEKGIITRWNNSKSIKLNHVFKYTPGSITVLTPAGDRKSLTIGSTVIDFAYSVHTEIGHHCVGAFVNGIKVKLNANLRDGDTVEVVYDENYAPQSFWLDIAQTPKARSRIRRYLRTYSPDAMKEKGWNQIRCSLRGFGIYFHDIPDHELLQELFKKAKINPEPNDLFVKIASNKLTEDEIERNVKLLKKAVDKLSLKEMNKLSIFEAIPDSQEEKRPIQLVSSCCTPSPFDRIVGYAHGNLINVHAESCPKTSYLKGENISVSWNPSIERYQAKIEIRGLNRVGLLKNICELFEPKGIDIVHVDGGREQQLFSEIHMTLEIPNLFTLNKICDEMREIDDIKEVISVSEQTTLREVRNPYTYSPIKNFSELYGRRSYIRLLIDQLQGKDRYQSVVIWGQKRIGKTSLLYGVKEYIENHSEECIPVLINLQEVAKVETGHIFLDIARGISKRLLNLGFIIEIPEVEVKENPLEAFPHFMERTFDTIPRNSTLLLLLDELLNLVNPGNSANLDMRMFSILRSLIQAYDEIAFIFTGTKTFDAIFPKELSQMLTVIGQQEISLLTSTAAEAILTRTVAPHLTYDKNVVEKVIDISGCHPFFLQIIGYETFMLMKEKDQSKVTISDYDEVIDSIAKERNIEYFECFWDGNGQVLSILSAIAKATDTGVWVDYNSLLDALTTTFDERKLQYLLNQMVRLKILERNENLYRIKVDLLRLWLQNNDYLVEEEIIKYKELELNWKN